MAGTPAAPARFVAIDIRRHDALVGAVDAHQRVVFVPGTVALADLESWLLQRLQPADAVVIMSLANAWQIHDTLAPGDIARFPSPSQLVGYAGLAGDQHAGHSKEEVLDVKEGRREIRATMLDVAEAPSIPIVTGARCLRHWNNALAHCARSWPSRASCW